MPTYKRPFDKGNLIVEFEVRVTALAMYRRDRCSFQIDFPTSLSPTQVRPCTMHVTQRWHRAQLSGIDEIFPPAKKQKVAESAEECVLTAVPAERAKPARGTREAYEEDGGDDDDDDDDGGEDGHAHRHGGGVQCAQQ
jgi:hypothetical protein